MHDPWTDTTSYRQGERKSEIRPRSWGLRSGGVYISITRDHIRNPGRWSLSCAPFFDVWDMNLDGIIDAQTAKRNAIRLVHQRLKSAATKLSIIGADMDAEQETRTP